MLFSEQIKPRILLACFPKSGSTFLAKTLSQYLDIPQKGMHLSNEIQVLARERLSSSINSGFCSQSHVLPTKLTVEMLNNFDIQTVILERNLLDCIVSLLDDFSESVKTQKGVWRNIFVGQFGCYDENFLSLTNERKCDYLIETNVNWYLEFYISWRRIQEDLINSPIFIRYEDFFADSYKNLQNLLVELQYYNEERYSNFQFPSKAAGVEGVRFNKGISGRGNIALSDKQKERIFEIVELFEESSQMSIKPIISS